jgi:acyl-CoA thioester hydrolase
LSRSADPASRAGSPIVRETKLRVRYSEIDAQGHVNNANYLSYFEVGRVEWLRDAGLSYKDLERRGFGFVVVEALVHYHSAAFFDDELTVRTELAEAGRVALRFGYEVLRDGERVATGHTRHACVRLPGGKPVRMPEEVRALAGRST